ncbi:MAG: thermonuclease family protein [Geminicoccales bacterium]
MATAGNPPGAIGVIWLASAWQEWTAGGDTQFRLCVRASQQDCVVDGDTFRYRGETIRVSDIDAPEVRDYQCASEAALGHRATERLLSLLNAGAFRLEASGRDRDRYGRLARLVIRDGRSLGDVLIGEGLARRWAGARHSWC